MRYFGFIFVSSLFLIANSAKSAENPWNQFVGCYYTLEKNGNAFPHLAGGDTSKGDSSYQTEDGTPVTEVSMTTVIEYKEEPGHITIGLGFHSILDQVGEHWENDGTHYYKFDGTLFLRSNERPADVYLEHSIKQLDEKRFLLTAKDCVPCSRDTFLLEKFPCDQKSQSSGRSVRLYGNKKD